MIIAINSTRFDKPTVPSFAFKFHFRFSTEKASFFTFVVKLLKMQPKTEMKTFCHIFAWLGLSSVQPYLRQKSPIHNTLIFVPTVIQAVIIVIEVCIVFTYPKALFHKGSILGAITDVLQVGAILFAGFVQLLENIMKFSLDQRIGKIIAEIDKDIFARHLCRGPRICSFCKQRSLTPFLVSRGFYLILVTTLVDSFIIASVPENEKTWQQSIIVREYTTIVLRIGVIQITCYLHWVSEEIHK